MNEREYRRLRAQIEADYREKLRALDLVWRMASASHAQRNGASAKRGALLTAARNALVAMRDQFSIKDVEGTILEGNPQLAVKRSSLSTVLRRLAESGQLLVVEVGKGKRPTSYRKP